MDKLPIIFLLIHIHSLIFLVFLSTTHLQPRHISLRTYSSSSSPSLPRLHPSIYNRPYIAIMGMSILLILLHPTDVCFAYCRPHMKAYKPTRNSTRLTLDILRYYLGRSSSHLGVRRFLLGHSRFPRLHLEPTVHRWGQRSLFVGPVHPLGPNPLGPSWLCVQVHLYNSQSRNTLRSSHCHCRPPCTRIQGGRH